MTARMLAALPLLSLLLFSQVMFMPTQVQALGFCGCGNCMKMYDPNPQCTCAYPYHWCFEDLKALQLQTSVHTYVEVPPSILVAPTSDITAPDVTENLVYLASGGKCLHSKVLLHLLKNTTGRT